MARKMARLFLGSADTIVRLWDGNHLAICRGSEPEVRSVCITKGGKIISGDRTVHVRELSLLPRIACMRMNEFKPEQE